ncbi:MAG: hypothetical protein AABY64_03855 [Bdellovibrionota bacterium]
MKSKVIFRNTLAKRSSYPNSTVLLYDQDLLKYSLSFRKWAKAFSVRIGLPAGEASKSLENFPELVQTVLKESENFSSREMTILVVGGGTLTDLGGFLASVIKRGVKLILVPTTWLAAMDSSHGGKNGLNISNYKNQIGTFYFPEKIEIVKEILFVQPEQRAVEVFGELMKMALISKSSLFSQLKKIKKIDNQKIYSALPLAIKAKNDVVNKDPLELKKIRHVLNLGHTFAHAIEGSFDISHGEAVLYGVVFSLIWSRSNKFLSDREFEEIIQATTWPISFQSDIYHQLLQAPVSDIKKSLMQDKKRSNKGNILEPFIYGRGKVVLKSIVINDFLSEFKRQRKLTQRAVHASKY